MTDEREAFEKWAFSEGLKIGRTKATVIAAYANTTTQHAWVGWQARAALDQQKMVVTEEMVDIADEAFSDVYDGVSHNRREAIRGALQSIAVELSKTKKEG